MGDRVGVSSIRGTVARWAAVLACAAFTASLSLLSQRAFADYTDGVAAFHKTSLEEAVRIWRKSAWQDDEFQSQMRLADLYFDTTNSHYFDPVEAYVWYYIAARNDAGRLRRGYYDNPQASQFIRDAIGRARARQAGILVNLEASQRQDAHDRIVYILSCQGSPGFIKLGDIHDTQYRGNARDTGDYTGDDDDRGYRGRSQDFGMVGLTSRSVMVPNDGEALVYYHIAESMGDPIGHFKLSALEDRLRNYDLGRRLIDDQAKKFHYWYPPFEFYPPGGNDSGVPLSDECRLGFERERAMALVLLALPQATMRQALSFLGWGHGDVRGIQRFQLTLGDPATGKLTAGEAVRAIQSAAVRGDAGSQNALGVMYSKGIGVVTNYARAAYWFQRAADQRYGAALYHLGVLYKVGPAGIKQDLSRANDYFTAAALAGFRPSLNQLSDLLARAAYAPSRPGQH